MNTHLILERLYRLRPKPRRRWRPLVKARRAVVTWVSRHSSRLSWISIFVAGWMLCHVYYYNKLITLEYDAKAAWAKVEAHQQKRNHIRRSLTRLLRYHAGYERSVMKEMTELRNEEQKKKNPPESPKQLLARLNAVAEQYPNLRLAETVQTLSDALTVTETEIAASITEYNSAVNNYTTTLNQFPGNLFGKPLGFREQEFYSPEDRTVLKFREVEP